MLWAVHCTDHPGAAARRAAARPAHSARLRTAPVPLQLYGALTAADGETPAGSLFLVEAPTREEVERFFAQDPFAIEGVWAQVQVHGLLPSPNAAATLRPR